MKLSMAGMISGAGQGASNALHTAQTGMMQSMLLEERDKMDTKRLQLMERYAMDRETRGETRAIAAEGRAEERTMATERRTDTRLEATETRRIGQAKTLREEARQEELDFTQKKGGDTEEGRLYRKALKTIAEASETNLVKAQTKLAEFKVLHMAADRNREIAKADAATAALIFRDATNEINHLSSQVTKAELNMDTAEADRLRTQIREAQATQRSARAKAAELIGIKKDTPAGKSKIVIPPGMEPQGAKKTEPATPAVPSGLIQGPAPPKKPVPSAMTKAGMSPDELAKYEAELAAYEAYVRSQGGGLPPAPK